MILMLFRSLPHPAQRRLAWWHDLVRCKHRRTPRTRLRTASSWIRLRRQPTGTRTDGVKMLLECVSCAWQVCGLRFSCSIYLRKDADARSRLRRSCTRWTSGGAWVPGTQHSAVHASNVKSRCVLLLSSAQRWPSHSPGPPLTPGFPCCRSPTTRGHYKGTDRPKVARTVSFLVRKRVHTLSSLSARPACVLMACIFLARPPAGLVEQKPKKGKPSNVHPILPPLIPPTHSSATGPPSHTSE